MSTARLTSCSSAVGRREHVAARRDGLRDGRARLRRDRGTDARGQRRAVERRERAGRRRGIESPLPSTRRQRERCRRLAERAEVLELALASSPNAAARPLANCGAFDSVAGPRRRKPRSQVRRVRAASRARGARAARAAPCSSTRASTAPSFSEILREALARSRASTLVGARGSGPRAAAAANRARDAVALAPSPTRAARPRRAPRWSDLRRRPGSRGITRATGISRVAIDDDVAARGLARPLRARRPSAIAGGRGPRAMPIGPSADIRMAGPQAPHAGRRRVVTGHRRDVQTFATTPLIRRCLSLPGARSPGAFS